MEKNTWITLALAVLIVISLAQAYHITSASETPSSAVSVETQSTPTQQAPEPTPIQQLPLQQQAQGGCGL